ncbi:uncharacterized protein LOC128497678 [Spea bombifrons]|uniref:uncharacterized protein LOC128497678 n=1 Tax=Spea bombifrons TaxID=233779 RepID=UPI00234AD27D|nr:uncharacterized protein LOC128497678 [Spea bombifrons]
MTLLIELYLLHGKDTYIDRGVAWGVFPLCDNNFNLLEGKFKCPFLRGHYDSKIDRFSKIEDLIMTDLDHWLCNLYFQVIKLPTFENEQDYEVFVQLPQEFLRYASHDEKNSEFEDAKKSVLQRDESKHLHHHQVTTSSIFYEQGQPLASYRHLNIQKELIPSTVENMESQLNIMKGEMDISKETQTKMNQKSLMQYVQVEEIAEQRTVRNLKQKMHKKGIPRNKVVPYVDKQALLLKEDFDTHQKKGKNATFEKRCHSTQKSETDIVKPMEQCSASTSYLEELEKHRFAVCSKTLNGMHMYQRIVKHTKLAIWAVFSEMEIGQWRSRDFWSIILMMTLMWFLRLYLHYCSQWLFLQAISIPVVKFTFYPHTVELNYQSSLLHIKEELGVVVIGPISLNVSMLIMILLRWSCQMLFNSFPTIMSKSIIACGLWTMLDPLAVLLMDAFLGRLSYSAEKPIGDAAKLYWIFYRTEQSGTPGIFITMLVYIMIFIISFSVLYLYLLRLHKESWILDVFQRISCNEELFYVPCDLEISNQEMSQIVQKAEQWRGINGERRKVTVYDYNRKKEASRKTSGSYNQQPGHLHSMTFEDDTNDITTHVLIYTIHLSGFQELYRQFLRLPDGAIVEIFGDCSGINQLPNEVSSTVKEHHNELESLDGNSTTADLRERKKSTTSC